MKFNTKKLIAAVDAEIIRRQKAADADYAAEVQKYEDAKAKWLASDNPARIADAARKITEKVRRGRVVTGDDIQALSRRWSSDDGPEPFNKVKPERSTKLRKPNVEQLEALRDFLAVVTDDEVTSSGLRDVGFRKIAQILRAAA